MSDTLPLWGRPLSRLRDRAGHHQRSGRMVGLAVACLIVISLYALIVPLAIPHDSRMTDYSVSGLPPSPAHLLGTDAEGRDLFVRVAIGLRLSLTIAVVVALSATLVGLLVGVVAAFAGGAVDQLLMRLGDVVNALPHLVLGLVIVALFRGSIMAIVLAMVVTHWVTIARVVRAQLLSLRTSDVVASAWVTGMRSRSIIRHHFIPPALGQTVISVLLTVPHIVWHESTFSFLGVGLPPHEPSLGTLLSEAQGGLLLGRWWLLLFPAGTLIIFTLAVGTLGRFLVERATTRTQEDV